MAGGGFYLFFIGNAMQEGFHKSKIINETWNNVLNNNSRAEEEIYCHLRKRQLSRFFIPNVAFKNMNHAETQKLQHGKAPKGN